MESYGVRGCIHVTTSTYERLKHRYDFQARSPIEVKGKGLMKTWFLVGRKGEEPITHVPMGFLAKDGAAQDAAASAEKLKA